MKRFLIIFCFGLYSLFVSGQSMVEIIFDFADIDYTYDIIEVEDGGYLILAGTTIDGVGKNVFIRINDNGDTLWTKFRPYYGYSLVRYDSSFYYVVGSYKNQNTGYRYGVLNMLDNEFNRIWIKTYPVGGVNTSFDKIKKTIDGELAMKRYHKLDEASSPPLEWLWVCDTSGNLLWSTHIRMNLNDYEQFTNKNYALVGTDHTNQNQLPDYVTIYDSSGNYLKWFDIEEDVGFRPNEIVLYYDTAYIFGADKMYSLDSNYDSLIWIADYNNNGAIVSACKGLENQFLLLGKRNLDLRKAATIFTVNSNGDSISYSEIDKFYKLWPRKIVSSDENFYLIGTIEYEDASRDIYFLKAPLDTVLVGERENISSKLQDLFNVYPNPAKTKITVSVQFAGQQEISLRTYNLNGQEIYNKTIPPNTTKHEIDISNWQPGIYVLSLYEGGKLLQTEKVVVVK